MTDPNVRAALARARDHLLDLIGADAVPGPERRAVAHALEELREASVLLGQGHDPDDDFGDIDPERFYSVAELVQMRQRPVSKQALYEALNTGRLKETLTGGPRGARGRDYIAWLKATRGRRRTRARNSLPERPETKPE